MLVLSTMTIMLIGLILGYSASIHLFKNTLIKDKTQKLQLLEAALAQILNEQVRDQTTFSTLDLTQKAIAAQNRSYSGMPAEDIQKEILQHDQKWLSTKNTDPFKINLLNNPTSLLLRHIKEAHPILLEFFITDKHGALVAASNVPSDYYQADESWWQKAFNQGKGQLIAEDIQFDTSVNDKALRQPLKIGC